jgi:signal peptidase
VRKGLLRIWKIATNILAAMILIMAMLLVGVRMVGYTPFVVLSGSMEPAYPTGSLIYVKKAAPEAVRVGDPITFQMSGGMTATHRVVAIDAANRTFTTKGDANNTADGSPVPFGSLIGIPTLCLPYLGYVSAFLSRPPGMYLGWTALAAVLLLLFLPDILSPSDKSGKKKEAKNKGESRKA